MNKPAKDGRVRLIGIVCSLLLLSACATNGSKTQSIEERAVARWDALLSSDLTGAYEFLSPGYRSSVSSVQYQRSLLLQQLSWTGADYLGSECTDVACKVQISVDYSVYGAVPGLKEYKGKQTLDESWVSVNGVWYYVPEN